MTLQYILLAVLVIQQLLDFYTTRRIIEAGGYEMNPVVKWFMDKLGLRVGLLITKLFVSVLAAAYIVAQHYWPILPSYWLTLPVSLFYTFVLYNNFTELKKQLAKST